MFGRRGLAHEPTIDRPCRILTARRADVHKTTVKVSKITKSNFVVLVSFAVFVRGREMFRAPCRTSDQI
jgi:hypothetical protein